MASANSQADEPLAEVLKWMRAKEKKLPPFPLLNITYRDDFAQKVFSKPHSEIEAVELHRFAEELMRSLYINRRSCSAFFASSVLFVLSHPATHPIDHCNLSECLRLFGLAPEELLGGHEVSAEPSVFLTRTISGTTANK